MRLPFSSLTLGCVFAIFFGLSAWAQLYSFGTAAGSPGHGAGTLGDPDGTNKNARFYGPFGLALDSSGDVFVTDGSAIRRMTPVGTNWVVTTIAGVGIGHGGMDGTNSVARFDGPQGIVADPAGNLFVADTVNNAIRKMTPLGTNWVVVTLAGSLDRFVPGSADGTNRVAQFNGPQGICLDANGNLFVADTRNNTIRKMAPSGTNWIVTTIAGLANNPGDADGSNSVARFNSPAAVLADTNGNLFVADFANNTIRKMFTSGTNWVVTTVAGSTNGMGFSDGTNSNARFYWPSGLALDNKGQIFVADNGNNTIRKMRLYGTNWVVTTLAGSPTFSGATDGVGPAATFTAPYGVTVDATGALMVSDNYNYTIRRGSVAAQLQIAAAGNQVVVSWPSALTNCVPQVSSNLSGNNWVTNTNVTVLAGDYYYQTNRNQGGSGFFRLRLP